MSNRSNLFLSEFDTGFQSHIIEFSKRLTTLSKQHDIIIFLARKAACLADCLDEMGLSKFHCVITSSRILDMDLKWMKGKRVAIVDDALISGTTINQSLEKLEQNDIKNVKVYVLSVDDHWWNRDMVKPEEPYFELDSAQTSQLCANIVRAISVVPRPYTIDYPLFKNIRIRETDFNELSNSGDWIVYESTSSYQDRHDIINLTIIPAEHTCMAFLNKLGLVNDPNFLLKIRLYALKVKEVYWCQVLPIVIFPRMKIAEIEKMFDRILVAAGQGSLCSWFNIGNTVDNISSRLRFVQYYISTQLGYTWHVEMMKKVDANIIFEQDFKNLNFLFPPPISDAIKNICSQDHVNFADLSVEFFPEEEEIEKSDNAEFDETSALYNLSTPFLRFYKDKELEARQRAKDMGPKVFSDDKYKGIMDRLNEGYSFNDLKGFIAGVADYINKGKLVSYFLDLFIDKGVVVPITYVRDGLVFRAFRHGEDVEFSENEMRLCMAMLHRFASEYGTDMIPHTILEKLLVLFVRIGIQKNFLTISTALLSDFQSIGIRYYLHGAVVGSFDKKIYKVNMDTSLTNLLTEAGYLDRPEYKDDYKLNAAPVTGMSSVGLSDANMLGSVLGNLMKAAKPKLTTGEVILISTIPTLVDAVGALAAEIYICQGFYLYEGKSFFPEYENIKIKKFREIRTKKAFTALNSGTWKYENFKNEMPWKIIQKALKLFDSPVYADIWNTFWPSMGKQTSKSSANPELIRLFERLADWLYTTRFYINLIEIALTTSFEEFRREPPLKEMQQMLLETKSFLPDLYIHLKRIYDRTYDQFLSRELKRKALYDYCTGKLSDNFQFSRQLLAEVDSLATSFGKIERVVFCDHTLLIDYKKFNQPIVKVKRIFSDIINEIRQESKRGDNVQFFEIPHHYSAIKTGTWVCVNGRNARHWLMRFANKLAEAMEPVAILKFTFFLHLDYFRICKRISSNEYEAPLFWDIAKELLRKKSKFKDGHELVYFTDKPASKGPIENEIRNELSSFKMAQSEDKIINVQKPYSLRFVSNHYIKLPKKPIQNLMDIGIITIVTPELLGVTEVFEINGSFSERRGTIVGKTYRFGKLVDKSGADLNTVVMQAAEQGNRSIISAYNAMAEEFNPRLVVLVGIGGSIHKDVGICDVAIANSIYYYDRRAETADGIERRVDAFKIGPYTLNLIQNFQYALKSEEPLLSAASGSPSAEFKTVVGPIGTGEAVIKFKEAEVRDWLLKTNSKTLAIETEAGGFAQQFYEDDINYSRRAEGILVIRGISDKADIEKDDKWRLAASKNAMTVLVEIIKANTLI